MAIRLTSNFMTDFILTLLHSLSQIDNLKAFDDFLTFCLNKQIDSKVLMPEDSTKYELQDLRYWLESRLICFEAEIPFGSAMDVKHFSKLIRDLRDVKWTFDQLQKLVSSFKLATKDISHLHLSQFLNTVLIYNLPPTAFEDILTVLKESKTFREIMQKVNNLAISLQFGEKVKDLNELVDELKTSNPELNYLMELDLEKIEEKILKRHYKNKTNKISNWSQEEIKQWAKNAKKAKEFDNEEAIAVLFQANHLVFRHRLTFTQILCCLIALKKGKMTNKLLQVATGEGKSTIICILAIIHALRGNKVDVITSSPVLAERDAKHKTELYQMFGLNCTDNGDKTVYIKGKKDCYQADVVYGEMSQFQFDYLRDKYSNLGTLGDRKFMIAIIDEVDSMLIDDSSKIARLSSTMAGMDHFQTIYVFIWQYLMSIKERFILLNNQMYFINGKIGFENDKITLQVICDDGYTIGHIPDLTEYVKSVKHNDSPYVQTVNDIEDFLRKQLETYLDYQIENKKIYIPSNFDDFVRNQKSKWVENAVEALNYHENIHYVIQDGEVRPVDFFSTGLVQSSTSWSNGLHQFLQLKHNLKMTSETRTTNFLSNIGFITKYPELYGLSGTLGSKAARNVLKEVYKVELIDIPRKEEKQYLELKPIIAHDQSTWFNEIISHVILEVQKNRGILVICETIAYANRICDLLRQRLGVSSVKLYSMNNMNQERNVEKVLQGQVVVATNLAGRGEYQNFGIVCSFRIRF